MLTSIFNHGQLLAPWKGAKQLDDAVPGGGDISPARVQTKITGAIADT